MSTSKRSEIYELEKKSLGKIAGKTKETKKWKNQMSESEIKNRIYFTVRVGIEVSLCVYALELFCIVKQRSGIF